MLKRILQLLDKSGNEHEDQRRLHLIFLVIGLAILLISAPMTFEAMGKYVYFGIFTVLVVLLAFAYKQQLWPARVIAPFVAFFAITWLIYRGGIHHYALGGYYFSLLIVGLMNGQRALLAFGLLSTLAVIVIGVAETSGWIATPFDPLTEPSTVGTTAFFLMGTTLALNFLVVRLNQAAIDAQRDQAAQIATNEKLRHLRAVLEERVEERTSELDDSNRQLMIQLDRVHRLQDKLREEAINDSLSGVFNRRFLDETLPIELARLKRMNSPLTILMLDVDHFKKINDSYGHQVGDAVIHAVGQLLKTSVRAGDIVCRYGGEEFTLVFPGMNAKNGWTQAEKLRVMIASRAVRGRDQLIDVTASIGGSVFPIDGTSSDELISVADRALYRAKANGRNRVEFAKPEDYLPDLKVATG